MIFMMFYGAFSDVWMVRKNVASGRMGRAHQGAVDRLAQVAWTTAPRRVGGKVVASRWKF